MTSFSNPYFEYLINETNNVDEIVSSKIRENVADLYKTDFILKLNNEYSDVENDVNVRFKELKQMITKPYPTTELKQVVDRMVSSESMALIKKLSDKLLRLTESINAQSLAFFHAIEIEEVLLADKLKTVNSNRIDLKHFQNMKVQNISKYEDMNARMLVYSIVLDLFVRLQEIVTEPVKHEDDLGTLLNEALRQMTYCKQNVPGTNNILDFCSSELQVVQNESPNIPTLEKNLQELKYKVNDIFRFSNISLKLCEKYYTGLNKLFDTSNYDKSKFRIMLERIRSAEYIEDTVSVSIAALTRLKRIKLVLAMMNHLFTSTFTNDISTLNHVVNNMIVQQSKRT